MKDILETYYKLFEVYLKICNGYNPERPNDNLEHCVRQCRRFQQELIGMLTLLEEAGYITEKQNKSEIERISENFCTIKLYRAYEEAGPVIVLGRHKMPEDPYSF